MNQETLSHFSKAEEREKVTYIDISAFLEFNTAFTKFYDFLVNNREDKILLKWRAPYHLVYVKYF